MIFSVAELQALYLHHMPLADPQGRPINPVIIEQRIRSAEAAFQRRYGLRLTPTAVKMGDAPLSGDARIGDLPVYHADAFPYDPRAFEGNRHVNLTLPIGPVREVYSVGLRLPGSQKPTEWPASWIQVGKKARTVQIFPMGSSVALPTLAGNGLGLIALSGHTAIPGAWQVVYEAGFTPEDLQEEYADVQTALGMLSAVAVLIPGSIDAFASAGVSGLSASVDGLSNSTQLAGGGQQLRHAALIQAYKEELVAFDKTFRATMLPMPFGVV